VICAVTSSLSSLAITLNDVPIDVLAERLSTTRGALYKTLHDARRKLRRCLIADSGEDMSSWIATGTQTR
jgi:RNA polymerase sigma-70 factor, ECF subfamily